MGNIYKQNYIKKYTRHSVNVVLTTNSPAV